MAPCVLTIVCLLILSGAGNVIIKQASPSVDSVVAAYQFVFQRVLGNRITSLCAMLWCSLSSISWAGFPPTAAGHKLIVLKMTVVYNKQVSYLSWLHGANFGALNAFNSTSNYLKLMMTLRSLKLLMSISATIRASLVLKLLIQVTSTTVTGNQFQWRMRLINIVILPADSVNRQLEPVSSQIGLDLIKLEEVGYIDIFACYYL